jgi:hypothetical protein
VLSDHEATAARTAAALTDGYTLAFSIAAALLVITAAVALATLPSLRAVSRAATAPPEAALPELGFDEALERT